MSIPEALAQGWPPLIILALLLGAIELILRKTEWLASFESPLVGRLASVDGLRAILAYGVVVCHVGTFYYMTQGAAWGPHPNPYFRQAGAASVRLFFMITGYLYWSKAIGGGGRLAPWRLYRNRLLRIMPLYALLIATLVVIALFASSFRLLEPPQRIAQELFGLIVPGFQTEGLINRFDYTEYMRQTWTLKWEIVFYALLPLIAAGARSLLTFAGLAFGLVLTTVIGHRFFAWFPDLSITVNFLVGMFAAHLKTARPQWKAAGTARVSATVLTIALIAPLVTDRVSIYLGNLLYAGLFLAVLYGNDLFGLLSLRSSKLLGEISYSVYLLHMLVLVPFMILLYRSMQPARLSHEEFWLLAAPAVATIVLLSFVTFRCVERLGIAKSHRPSVT